MALPSSIPSGSADSPGSRSSTDERLAERIADRFLGVPYEPGGRDPDRGLDCFGLVGEFLLRAYGISDLGPERWERASPRSIRPGDVLCFDRGGLVGHVGVALLGGLFLHSVHPPGVVRARVSDFLPGLHAVLRYRRVP